MTHLLPRIGTPVAVVLSGLLLSSCAMFRPEEEEDAKKKDRFEFLRSERQPREAAKPESIEEEQVLPKPAGEGELGKKKLEALSYKGGKPAPPEASILSNHVVSFRSQGMFVSRSPAGSS